MCNTFLDVIDFKELLNTATGRLKKRSLFNERTEKASASQYFQVRINASKMADTNLRDQDYTRKL